MHRKEHINQLIDEAINSVNEAKRAVPLPFLLTRMHARLNKTKGNVWEKVGWFIGRPAFAIPGLLLLVFINAIVVFVTRQPTFTATTEQPSQPASDDFSYTVATIYDIENIEP